MGASLYDPRILDVLEFWNGAGENRWFKKDAAFDQEISSRFAGLYGYATGGELEFWQNDPCGALALVLVLDQFPRNMFRNDARAFASDKHSLSIAKKSLERGYDRAFDVPLVSFFYMPFMHSEVLEDQETCLALFKKHGETQGLKSAVTHADIIRSFGRFPHRNAILGRVTTAKEQAFLDAGGFAG